MSQENQLIIRWVKCGVVCGIAADLCYGLAMGLPMPRMLSNIVFWSFGPLLIASTPGVFYFIKRYRHWLGGFVSEFSNVPNASGCGGLI